MNVISGVSEGTWIVFAEKAMAERDEAIEGTGKMRDALRAAEKRELEALEELDEATAILVAVAKLLMANGCDCECGHDSEGHDDDCERCFACKVSAAIGELA